VTATALQTAQKREDVAAVAGHVERRVRCLSPKRGDRIAATTDMPCNATTERGFRLGAPEPAMNAGFPRKGDGGMKAPQTDDRPERRPPSHTALLAQTVERARPAQRRVPDARPGRLMSTRGAARSVVRFHGRAPNAVLAGRGQQ
jgi:hypothetical protein